MMIGKPFRPPLLKKPGNIQEQEDQETSEPRIKKRRISDDQESDGTAPTQLVFKKPGISSLPRKPLIAVNNPPVNAQSDEAYDRGVESYYNVLWRKFTTKKHKTWDGDGVLHIHGGYAFLQDISGREMRKTTCDAPLLPGSMLAIGGKEVEVDSVMTKSDIQTVKSNPSAAITKPVTEVKKLSVPGPQRKVKSKSALLQQEKKTKMIQHTPTPRSGAAQAPFKGPLLSTTVLPKSANREITPRHCAGDPGALVMKHPDTQRNIKPIVDVVVDPILTKPLREHQREGIKFMYECVMGMRNNEGQGAILADEMGLGKTLQTIALLWTLLKQNPVYEDPPIIRKALIVCPVTLINNWRKEFRKWLGRDRIGVFTYDDSKKRISDFTKSRSYQIMIVGYEKLRTVIEQLQKTDVIDIVIADEGHRLKTAKNKSAQAIKSLSTSRRIILSGTPIQNDLSEFFMMVDFVNPGLLGDFRAFARRFEAPIIKSRQPGVSKDEAEKGRLASDDLASITSTFILRRTADLLSTYLPPKTESVLLCRPTAAQVSVYQHVLASPAFQAALGSPEASLQLITVLKKVCNSPSLLNSKILSDPSAPLSPLTASLLSSIPAQLLRSNSGSTKIRVLDQLLHILRTTTQEKVILVSNYTQTLDVLQTLLTSLAHPYLRLDGSTPSAKRQELVDEFNRSPASQCFAFLLSARSGGVGLNLIGASRLVLFDADWNPATDLQAMARIHRDGQKKPCFVYRFAMAGGLDEKIWQRQVTKLGLASNIMDQKGGASNFSQEELKDLFKLDEGSSCQTHDLLGCRCEGRGLSDAGAEEDFTPIETYDSDGSGNDDDDDLPPMPKLKQASKVDVEEQERQVKEHSEASSTKDGRRIESLMAYSHVDTSKFATEQNEDMEAMIHDEVLLKVLKDEGNRVAFVFTKTSG